MERVPISQLGSIGTPQSPVTHAEPIEPAVMLNDVPLDILRHFDIDHRQLVEGDKKYLNDIYRWVAEDMIEPTPGNIMGGIKDIQMRIGGDRTFTKVWNWLRAKQSIKDMSKKQRAMEQGYVNIWTT